MWLNKGMKIFSTYRLYLSNLFRFILLFTSRYYWASLRISVNLSWRRNLRSIISLFLADPYIMFFSSELIWRRFMCYDKSVVPSIFGCTRKFCLQSDVRHWLKCARLLEWEVYVDFLNAYIFAICCSFFSSVFCHIIIKYT